MSKKAKSWLVLGSCLLALLVHGHGCAVQPAAAEWREETDDGGC